MWNDFKNCDAEAKEQEYAMKKEEWIKENSPKFIPGVKFSNWLIIEEGEFESDEVGVYHSTNFRYSYLCFNEATGKIRRFGEKLIDKIIAALNIQILCNSSTILPYIPSDNSSDPYPHKGIL